MPSTIAVFFDRPKSNNHFVQPVDQAICSLLMLQPIHRKCLPAMSVYFRDASLQPDSLDDASTKVKPG